MRDTTTLRLLKTTFTFALIIFCFNSYAQVGIGNTSPNGDSLLDIGDGTDTQGLLIPRVGLSATNLSNPLGAHVAGMLVYNTATAGSGGTAVTPGFYYNDGSDWIRIGSGTASDDWTTTGNVGTNASTNFIGTTDNVDFRVRTNNSNRFTFTTNGRLRSHNNGSSSQPAYSWNSDTNTGFYRIGGDDLGIATGGTERMSIGSTDLIINEDGADYNLRMETSGDANTLIIDGGNDNVGIGVLSPAANVKLEVNGGSQNGIFGYSSNVGGYLGRETNITFGTPSQTVLGAGVYANNPLAGYTSTFAQSTGAATVAANINFSDVWIANYNYVQNASALYNPSAVYAQLNVTNSGLGGYKSPITTYSNRGSTSGNPWYTLGLYAQSVTQNEDGFGLLANLFTDRVYSAFGIAAGGSFSTNDYTFGSTFSWADVASYTGGVDNKVIGSGAVSTLIKDEFNINRVMYAPEAPEVLFQDFGVGTLVNGTATIQIDPILAKNIYVDPSHPLKVFIQLEGDCNGVYVTNKSANGFTVVELQNGTSNIDFSWQIVANRKDRKGDSDFADSKFQDVRLPKYIKKGGFKQKIEKPSASKDE